MLGYEARTRHDAVRHIHRQHGNPASESTRGQRAVTTLDYDRLRSVLAEPDAVSPGQTPERVLVEKQFGGERVHAVFEATHRRKKLRLHTLWITIKKGGTGVS